MAAPRDGALTWPPVVIYNTQLVPGGVYHRIDDFLISTLRDRFFFFLLCCNSFAVLYCLDWVCVNVHVAHAPARARASLAGELASVFSVCSSAAVLPVSFFFYFCLCTWPTTQIFHSKVASSITDLNCWLVQF